MTSACLPLQVSISIDCLSFTTRSSLNRFYDCRLVQVSSLGGVALRVVPATKNAQLSDQMDRLPRVLLVEKSARQQLAIENILRREGFQWDLASSGEQAAANFTRLANTNAMGTSSSSSNYDLILICDSLTDSEVRAIDRFVGPKERTKRKSGPQPLVCVVVSEPGADVPFAKATCAACRRSQGRRVSQEMATTPEVGALDPPPMACPHCGLVAGASARTTLLSPALAEETQAIVYKHVKAATLHRLAEVWAATWRAVASNSAPPSRHGRRHTDDSSHLGLTPTSFFAEVDKQLAAAKRGVFLPEHHVPEMALSAKDTVLVQQALAAPTGSGANRGRDQMRSGSA
ncbi:hypothetical protein BBJ28_00025548 [Nothophytophthora sp. Chile5]|nr:hypothetical protein BBJ28_00025548 [Nothophytophthora sp. Chile5]